MSASPRVIRTRSDRQKEMNQQSAQKSPATPASPASRKSPGVKQPVKTVVDSSLLGGSKSPSRTPTPLPVEKKGRCQYRLKMKRVLASNDKILVSILVALVIVAVCFPVISPAVVIVMIVWLAAHFKGLI